MKARTVKKLSKRLAEILAPEKYQIKDRLFHPIWVDADYEHPGYFWRHRTDEMTPKQRRAHLQSKTSVTNVPSVGGEYDSYAGDCSDHFTVLDVFSGHAAWLFGKQRTTVIKGGPMAGDVVPDWPELNIKLTGKNLVALAKKYEREHAA